MIRQLEKYPFTAETLVKLGITRSILQHTFAEWLSDPNYRVDFENEIIYVGLVDVRKNLDDLEQMIIKNGWHEGLAKVREQIKDTKERLELISSHLTDSQKKDFYLKYAEDSIRKGVGYQKELYEEMAKMAEDPNYLPPSSDGETSTDEKNNPFPRVFEGQSAYELFMIFLERSGEPDFQDFSFIFQQMLKDEHLVHMPHQRFMNWLREFDFITEPQHHEFLYKGSFVGLSKTAKHRNRLSVYNRIKKELGMR